MAAFQTADEFSDNKVQDQSILKIDENESVKILSSHDPSPDRPQIKNN